MALELPVPNVIEVDAQAIILDLINKYQADTGVVLQPAQIETLLLNTIAYRTQLNLQQMNLAALQGLIDFSTAPILDYLVANFGVERLPPSNAVCKIRFTLNPGHGVLVIPAGLRVQSLDGLVFFLTDVPTSVDAITNIVDINCTCNVSGVIGNGYAIGDINVILDPQPYLLTASNIEVTGNGGDAETDEQLRSRYKLRLSSFSTAGSTNAYKFYARSVSSSIIDVSVISPYPGAVAIYPLMEGGVVPPQAILDAVFNKCNALDVRPLTDTVTSVSPNLINFDITLNVTLYNWADPTIVAALINEAMDAYRITLYSQLGLNVVLTEIHRLAKVLGVYDLVAVLPLANIVIAENEVAILGGVNINFIGTNAG
jgi:phage-related baseplate assembly protein